VVEREPPGADRGGWALLTERLTWSTWREALAVVTQRSSLTKTVGIALVVGTVLFAINQLDVVARGHATTVVYLKVGLTYLVPFCVSNYGVLIATRRPRE
jgi:hypothetical protein